MFQVNMPNEDKIINQEQHGTQQEVVRACVRACVFVLKQHGDVQPRMVSIHALGI